jgi:hypothetical protein
MLSTISIPRLPEAHEKAEEIQKCTDEASGDHVMPSLLNMYDSVLNATGFTRLDIQPSTHKREDDASRIHTSRRRPPQMLCACPPEMTFL